MFRQLKTLMIIYTNIQWYYDVSNYMTLKTYITHLGNINAINGTTSH